MKSRLIANPVAGADAAPDVLQLINERLRASIGAMDIVLTVGEGDARHAAESAAAEGYDHLYVAGGDGTLNEAINGVARVAGGFERVTFGIVPLGTGNDFATALGFPEDLEPALDALVDAAARHVDVGVLNEHHYFVNVSAGGFVAEVSDAVDPQLKSLAGKLAYVIGGARVILNHEPAHVEVQIGSGSAPWESSLHFFAVCNSRLFGGGRIIAPQALIDDGLLDVCLIEAMPTVEFVALLARVSSGEHVGDERVTYVRASELHLRFDRPVKVNTDGQVLEADQCRYRVLPRAARFLIPAARNARNTQPATGR